MLLKAGAKVDVISDSGDTQLHYSVYGNKPEIVARLLKEGCCFGVSFDSPLLEQ